VAAGEVLGVLGREAGALAQGLVPAVGDLGQRRIERGAELGDRVGQRIGEVAVLPAAEAVAGHDHRRAEAVAVVAGGQGLAGGAVEQAGKHRAAVGVEITGDGGPVDVGQGHVGR